MWSDRLVFYDYDFTVSSLWCPLTTPTILLGLLLPWTWGISSWLLQQSTANAPYLGWGVSPHGRPSWPRMWSSYSWPSCAHTGATPWMWGLLLSAAAPDLERVVAPLGCSPWPWAKGSSSRPCFCAAHRNVAGQRLIEFCQENALVIANTLFQQHKRRLYTWTSPDGQHHNQIDCIICSQRWRRCIQSVKTQPGADCGSDHELLIAKFRLKWKKVGKTTRPFRYDLNQIPYDYTVEVRNRFKGLDLIHRVSAELWMEVHDTVQETGIRTTPMEKKCKKAKWLSGEALKIAVKRREVKSKGEKERYKHLNAEVPRIARSDKKAFLNYLWKEIEENNRMGKTRDLFKKIRDTKGTFHAKMGSIKQKWYGPNRIRRY